MSVLFGLDLIGPLGRKPGQCYKKDTPLAWLTFDPDMSIIKFDNFPANEQTQSSTADTAGHRIINPVKFLEHMRDILSRYAWPGVFNLDLKDLIIAGNSHGDTTSHGVLDTVVDNVLKNFTQTIGVDKAKV